MSLTTEMAPKSAPAPPKTRIILRRFRAAPRQAVALMVDLSGASEGTCLSYTLAGKQEDARYESVMKTSERPHLGDEDVLNLVEEIKSVGHVPSIILRYSRPG